MALHVLHFLLLLLLLLLAQLICAHRARGFSSPPKRRLLLLLLLLPAASAIACPITHLCKDVLWPPEVHACAARPTPTAATREAILQALFTILVIDLTLLRVRQHLQHEELMLSAGTSRLCCMLQRCIDDSSLGVRQAA